MGALGQRLLGAWTVAMWGNEAGQATVLLQIPSPRGETGPEDDQSGAHERRGLAQGLSYPHPGAALSVATCLRSRCGPERAGTGKRRKTREGSIYVCHLLLHNKLPPHLADEESEHLLCRNTDLTVKPSSGDLRPPSPIHELPSPRLPRLHRLALQSTFLSAHCLSSGPLSQVEAT